MECNKDEAARSKVIAEAKFLQHDWAGAKKFALKARQLFPELDGLPQFISVLDVHTTAQEKLQSGETNWYGILQVDPTADDGTIRKQYRKLALLLHPDKNKSVGAEAAFKHISEAWGVLSDKTKKALHDRRRNPQPSQRTKVSLHKQNVQASKVHRNATRSSPPDKPQPQPATPPPRPPSPPPVVNTFWTACPLCKIQFEYQRVYENNYLCCVICYKPFLARQVAFIGGTTLWPPQEEQGFCEDAGGVQHRANKNGLANGSKSSTFANSNSSWSPFGNVPAGNGVPRQMNGRAKKEKAGVQLPKEVSNSNSPLSPFGNVSSGNGVPPQQMNGRAKEDKAGVQPPTKEGGKKEKHKGRKKWEADQNKAKAAAQAKEVLDRLIAKSKVVIEQKLSSDKAARSERQFTAANAGFVWPEQSAVSEQWNSFGQRAPSGKTTPVKVHASNIGNEGKENRFVQENTDADKTGSPGPSISKSATRKSPRDKKNTSTRADPVEVQDDLSAAKKTRIDVPIYANEHEIEELHGGKSEKVEILQPHLGADATTCGMDLDSEPVAADAMNVPDADFFDFDKDRTEYHFFVGQIWAAYDDDDGMPRYYARISKVISRQPFKVQISWLEARCPSDETVAWLQSGFSYTCGEYKLGQTVTSEYINTFSHLMKFEKVQRGGFKIYPTKGEVWALYKSWNTLKTKDAKQGYEMVEVLTDFKEDVGIQTCILVKIEGFKALFSRHIGSHCEQWISPNELRRFSHQVPAHHLSTEQAPGIQDGCWELDPASIPMDLITGSQVT